MLKPDDIAILKRFITSEIETSWKKEGHLLTGAMVNDMDVQIKTMPDAVFEGYLYKYAKYMNEGVSGDRIKSRYAPARIEGLMRYVKLRMGINDLKQSRSIAYAIATLHKQRGMPLRAVTGTKWVNKALQKMSEKFSQKLFEVYEKDFSLQIENMFTKYQLN
jgi:hypothetical protein